MTLINKQCHVVNVCRSQAPTAVPLAHLPPFVGLGTAPITSRVYNRVQVQITDIWVLLQDSHANFSPLLMAWYLQLRQVFQRRRIRAAGPPQAPQSPETYQEWVR